MLARSEADLKAAKQRKAHAAERERAAELALEALESSDELEHEAKRKEGARTALLSKQQEEEARQTAIAQLESQRANLTKQLEARTKFNLPRRVRAEPDARAFYTTA